MDLQVLQGYRSKCNRAVIILCNITFFINKLFDQKKDNFFPQYYCLIINCVKHKGPFLNCGWFDKHKQGDDRHLRQFFLLSFFYSALYVLFLIYNLSAVPYNAISIPVQSVNLKKT